jgi:formyltetrahydrofolate-dependent phosphoribosylglycinamide formyltransferase
MSSFVNIKNLPNKFLHFLSYNFLIKVVKQQFISIYSSAPKNLMKKRVVVLISGNGSNLQAIIDANIVNVELVLVLSNRVHAYGLERAKTANIATKIFTLKSFKDAGNGDRLDYDIELAKIIHQYSPDIVVLAGWMHILSKEFLLLLPNISIINLHPALPNEFDGANAIERAYNAYKEGLIERTGVMVHFVTPEVDKGQVIVKREVRILPTYSLHELEEEMHKVEHSLIVEAIRELSNH